MDLTDLRLTIVGYGRLGKVLTKSLLANNLNLHSVIESQFKIEESSNLNIKISDNPIEFTDHNLIIICVPDSSIPEAVRNLLNQAKAGSNNFVFHTSGSQSSELLSPLKALGVHTLSWHPLQTFTGTEDSDHFHDVMFVMDGENEAISIGAQLASKLGGYAVAIPGSQRILYHLGAVFGCNFIPAITSIAVDFLIQSGIPKEQALHALKNIQYSTLKNMYDLGIPDSITGPVRRNDTETIDLHLKKLTDTPELKQLYLSLTSALVSQVNQNKQIKQ